MQQKKKVYKINTQYKKTMEEKKQETAEPKKKLSYEELNQAASDLYVQNKKMQEYIIKLRAELDQEAFNRTSFFISMLFKVMEHPEMYSGEFVKWSVDNIETALRTFSSAMDEAAAEAEKEENAQNEAE